MSGAQYAARMTMCKCGHEGIAHYDSHDFCTHKLDGMCGCEKFEASGPEVYVQVGTALNPGHGAAVTTKESEPS